MTDTVIELSDVDFRRSGVEILRGITLTVRAGERWALLGPNGAGKSTILGFCGAQTHPSSGTAHVLGHRLGRVDMQALRHEIGHVNPRHPLGSALTMREVVLTGLTATIELAMRWEPTAADLASADAAIDRVGLGHRRDARWPTMSQGERGRALIARALVAAPRLLLLDEPTTGLDVAAREQFLETVDALAETDPELTTILVTHHLEELPESTTHAVVIAHGEIVAAGPVAEVVTTEVISRAFEHPIRVSRADGRWAARAGRAAPRAA
ncbi:ABC transporter ATP-binding protein [Leucobacter luti]|uniref:Iron complex transport system ATP-binding protein n=1 Tax=Leucobacter luti TaxID=340320 RepID=A0A4Q7U6A5_9MICO|nr:ATP-binding cassette domain-containing protein [Leucobacter luti]MBL3700909.1 ATP-binding cassette domain-containing protein [Leucobacter luti]RZT68873.1 iron complex transport system ATP-binding protein [Leucobacter luti]